MTKDIDEKITKLAVAHTRNGSSFNSAFAWCW